jgi:DNA-binding response OmpR family regulator
MASVLRSAGFQTATAENAADAQRELELRRPDLVVLRAELPDQSGFVLCGQIKKGRFGQNLPVLLLSSDVGQEGLAQHSQGPNAADGYLTIPFEMGELAELTHGIMPPAAPGGRRRHGPLAGRGADRRGPSHTDAGDASGAAAAPGAPAGQSSAPAAA